MTSVYPLNKIFLGLAIGVCFCVGSVMAQGQQTPNTPAADTAAKLEQPRTAEAAPAKTTLTPFVHSVRDVELGMSVDDVKKKLGRPEVQDDTGLLFTLAGGDSVQIGLDENKHVRTVAQRMP